jgi:hypothetical protein
VPSPNQTETSLRRRHQGAGVPEQVHEVEARPLRRPRRSSLRFKEGPERVRLIAPYQAGRHGSLDVAAGHHDDVAARGTCFGARRH